MATGPGSSDIDRNGHQQIGRDRQQTDDSLRAERERTDKLLEVDQLEQRVGDVLDQEREKAEARLEGLRTQVDSHLSRQADLLPQISAELEDVAESLTEAATNLTGGADTLKAPVVAPTGYSSSASGASRQTEQTVGDLAQAAEQLSAAATQFTTPPSAVEGPVGTLWDAQVVADTSGELIERIAEVAGTIAEVTADLDGERRMADEKLRKERQVTDHIIDQQLAQTETIVTAELQEEKQLLVRERRATDEDLSQERQHTDEAIDHVLALLLEEQTAHTVVQQAFATRNEFLTILSHDLRGPLATIDAAAKFIIAAAPGTVHEERVRDGAERIRRSTAIMNRLIRDLLDFRSLEDGQLQVVAKHQDVRPLINRAIDIFLPLAGSKGIVIEARIPEDSVMAVYDFDRMLQVTSNLLENAIKFTAEGGQIQVRAAPAGRECLIAVSDTGIGIAEEELTSIFERFRQLGGNRSGLGLGLYISKWMVEAHRGRIWADSRPGSGSTFYFTLPVE